MNKKIFTLILTLSILLAFFVGSAVNAALFELKLDFQSEDEETSAADIMDLIDIWEISVGIPGNGAFVKTTGDDKYITTTGYVDIRTWDLLDAPYTFSVDFKLQGDGDEKVGFFVKSVTPIVKKNPMNHDVDQVFSYFEWDWYGENGGKNGTSSIGGSGIAVHPTKTGFIVRVKNWQPDGLNTSSVKVTLPVPEGVDMTGFVTLKFVDEGTKVTIYVNDKVLATADMADPGVYEEDAEDSNKYYKTVVVKDAAGTDVLSLDNAKVSAEGCQVAIGNRNTSIHLDNLYVAYTVPDPTPTPEKTATPVPTNTPTPTVNKTDSKSETGDSNSSWILPVTIGIGVVVVIGVGVILFKVSNKKK